MKIAEEFQALLSALQRRVERPPDLVPVLAGAALKRLPMPQLTWMLLGLVAYTERLRWAWEVAHRRLHDEVHYALKTRGELQGTVPDMPDWRYEIGWFRLDLSHKGTHERLALSLDKSYRFIEEEELITYYCDHREPAVAEQRLGELFPRGEALFAVVSCLAQGGMVRKLPAGLELTPKVSRRVPDIANFLERWRDPAERLGLAVAVGDWPAAHETAVARGQNEPAEVLAPLAEQCRQRWREWLCAQVAERGINWVGIHALARAGVENLPQYLTQALSHDCEAPSAVDFIAEDPSWCATIFRLLMGERERGKRGWSRSDRAYITYLNQRHYRMAEVMDLLLTDRASPLDLLIPLALEHRQDSLLTLLRRGLRSACNHNRQTAAAVLALFDADWSRRELVARLDEPGDWEKTIECRLALLESGDAALWELADRWGAERPEEAADYNSRVRTHAEHFRDRVSELFELVHRHRAFRPSEVGSPHVP